MVGFINSSWALDEPFIMNWTNLLIFYFLIIYKEKRQYMKLRNWVLGKVKYEKVLFIKHNEKVIKIYYKKIYPFENLTIYFMTSKIKTR